MNRKVIGSLKLKRLCFVIQRLTLRRIDSLKLRHSYLHFLIPIRSMNRKLIDSLRLKHLMKRKQKLRLTDSLILRHWYLMTH